MKLGLEPLEKVQLAMDGMFGVTEALLDKTIRPFRGVREAYVTCTGDSDCSQILHGGVYRATEVIQSSTFANILLNSMTKRLIQDYAEIGLGGLERLITENEVEDFKTQHRVRLGYLADLATVAENAAYTEFANPTDDLIQFVVTKRGNYQDVTWEAIVNDDTGKIRAYPTRAARAARRTLKQFITDFLVNNPNYDADAVAWFHATHANLGSLALSDTELDARELALMKQTEKDSNKRLGLPLEWIMVPVDQKATAYQLNNNNDGANSWYHRFGMNEMEPERIIVNQLLSDTNDWYGGSLPSTAPFLEIAYLRGFRAPRIFEVSVEQGRQATAIDKMRFFAVHVYGGDIMDFRPVFKASVV